MSSTENLYPVQDWNIIIYVRYVNIANMVLPVFTKTSNEAHSLTIKR